MFAHTDDNLSNAEAEEMAAAQVGNDWPLLSDSAYVQMMDEVTESFDEAQHVFPPHGSAATVGDWAGFFHDETGRHLNDDPSRD